MPEVVESKRTGPLLNWGTLFRAVVTISILTYLAAKLDWAELISNISEARPLPALVALVLFGIMVSISGLRWWIMLKVQEIHIPVSTALALTYIGFFFNAFMLGSTGGDVIRAYYVLRFAPGRKAKAVLSVLMDRVLGLLVLLALVVFSLPLQIPYLRQSPETATLAWTLTGLLAVAVVGIVVLTFFPFHMLPASMALLWSRLPGSQVAESLLEGFRQYSRSRTLSGYAIAISVLNHFFNFAVAYTIAVSLNMPATFLQTSMVYALVMLIIALPISISGHGVRELAFVQVFALFGIVHIDPSTGQGGEAALAFSIIFLGIQLFWNVLGGLVYLGYAHTLKASSVADEAA